MSVQWVHRPCPLCGSSDDSRVFAPANVDTAAGFAFSSRKIPEHMHPRLVECPECGLLYANPAFAPEWLESAYERAPFDTGDEAAHAGRTYIGHVARLLSRLPDRVGALDIGTGDGAFLDELLRLGFVEVRGVEPSEASMAAAKPHLRGLIRGGLFRPQDYAARSLSLVTCFQVMEHVWHPLETARSVLSLLKPGGAFVTVVHDRTALSAKLMGLKSPIYDVEHLQLFSPTTVGDLLRRAGYEAIDVQPMWNRYPVAYWTRLLPVPMQLKRAVLRVLDTSSVGRTPVSLPAGNLVCVGFRPA